MDHMFCIGEQVRFKNTDFRGEIVGVGHTMMMSNSSPDHNRPAPTAMPFEHFIVRLRDPFIVTSFDVIIRQRAPSSFPGCLFVYELTAAKDQLELDK